MSKKRSISQVESTGPSVTVSSTSSSSSPGASSLSRTTPLASPQWPLQTCIPSARLPPRQQVWLEPGDFFEIYGRSGTGKTQFLYEAAITCALPEYYNGIFMGGSGKSVLFFDLDYRMQMNRFDHLLTEHVGRAVREAQPDKPIKIFFASSYETLRNIVFNRIFLIRCQTAGSISRSRIICYKIIHHPFFLFIIYVYSLHR